MQILIQPCKCYYLSLSLNSFNSLLKTLAKTQSSLCTPFHCSTTRNSISTKNFKVLRSAHFSLCSRNNAFGGFSSTHNELEEELSSENGELGLLDKPFPVPRDDSEASSLEVDDERVDEDEALAPFLKFFNTNDEADSEKVKGGEFGESEEKLVLEDEEEEEKKKKKVSVEYYEPKSGDFVVGVVVSGNENKLDVNVGADLLGTMLTKEVLPFYEKELDYLLCDLNNNAEEFYVPGKMGVVKYDDDGLSTVPPVSGRPVVEPGTVLFAEVLGRTLSGRPLLSTRRLFRRIAWHRVRQIKQLNEPIEVRITEWNTGGLLTRIEGLRAFIPKAELMRRINNFGELKEKVGCCMKVLVTRINDEKNDLILSEKEAWQMLNLREGALLEGTVRKIFPFGAQIRIAETNRSGLLHISNITRGEISSVSDVLAVGEKVKVVVVKSMFPDKIALSIADLESEPGLFTSNKERVFSEAEMMVKIYRAKLVDVSNTGRSEASPTDSIAFESEAKMYANWKWFKFERDEKQTDP